MSGRRLARCILVLAAASAAGAAWAQGEIPARLAVCFVPPERCGVRIAQAILRARQSVRVQAYGFDYPPIVAALIADRLRAVDVQVILDRSNEHRRSSGLPRIAAAGIPVFIDDRPAIAHSKIIIVDSCLVIGGSFNYTRSAEDRNAENVTFLDGCQAAAPFIRNWQTRRAVSRPAVILSGPAD